MATCRLNRLIIAVMLYVFSLPFAISAEPTDSIPLESIDLEDIELFVDTVPHASDTLLLKNKSKFNFWKSLFNGNVDRTFERPIDLSFIPAPSYSREGGFGIGFLASALYRIDRTDSLMPPSNISLSGNASLKGFFTTALDGNNYFKGRKSRLSYILSFTHKNLNFWGVNYADCASNPMIGITRQQLRLHIEYLYRVLPQMNVGAIYTLNFGNAPKMQDYTYLDGQNNSYIVNGLGLIVQYDTRDFIPNPQRGLFIMIKETYFPRFASNSGKGILRTNFQFNYFQTLWPKAILAFDVYGELHNGDVPWPMRPEIGNYSRMRGYYTGRYLDNNLLAAQIELRQYIFWRLGVVVWGGAGTVFPHWNYLEWGAVLPTYGLGLRFEFKHHVNVRVDYGFGKQTGGIVFGLSEAF